MEKAVAESVAEDASLSIDEIVWIYRTDKKEYEICIGDIEEDVGDDLQIFFGGERVYL